MSVRLHGAVRGGGASDKDEAAIKMSDRKAHLFHRADIFLSLQTAANSCKQLPAAFLCFQSHLDILTNNLTQMERRYRQYDKESAGRAEPEQNQSRTSRTTTNSRENVYFTCSLEQTRSSTQAPHHHLHHSDNSFYSERVNEVKKHFKEASSKPIHRV